MSANYRDGLCIFGLYISSYFYFYFSCIYRIFINDRYVHVCVCINLRNINEPWIRTIELYTNEIKNIYKNVVINILRIYNDENE